MTSPQISEPSHVPRVTPPDLQPLPPEAGPGALRGRVSLTVQTRQAQQLIRGRNGSARKPAIIGLVGFADRLRVIWQAARRDDPYADWWLIKIHEAIEQGGQLIRSWQAQVERRLADQPGLEVCIADSERPHRIHLQFANPYAYRGAQLLAEFDTLVRAILTAHHIGLLDNAFARTLIHSGGKTMRSTFAIAQGYRCLEIDRATLRTDDKKRERARQAMGALPDEVLRGNRQAPLFPGRSQTSPGERNPTALEPQPAEPVHSDDNG